MIYNVSRFSHFDRGLKHRVIKHFKALMPDDVLLAAEDVTTLKANNYLHLPPRCNLFVDVLTLVSLGLLFWSI